MENNTAKELPNVTMTTPPERWKTYLRQGSKTMGTFAENVVLPKNQRSVERCSAVAFRDVEAHISYMTSATTLNPLEMQPKAFPIFIIGISAIQIALMCFVDHEKLKLLFGYDPYRRYELWRYVTIMLAHTGFPHLWSNMFQLILGMLLETVHRWRRIAIIYLASIVGGSLFITVLNPQTYTVGASAAVYGLLFSHLSTIVLNWNEMDRRFCRLFGLTSYIALEIGISFILFYKHKGDNISFAAHIGGAVTGFLVSILVLKNFVEHTWEKRMQKVCVGIITVLFVIIFLINVTVWNLYLPTEWNFNYQKSYDETVFKAIVESPTLHKSCMEISECQLVLDQYNFNGTIRTDNFNAIFS